LPAHIVALVAENNKAIKQPHKHTKVKHIIADSIIPIPLYNHGIPNSPMVPNAPTIIIIHDIVKPKAFFIFSTPFLFSFTI